MSDELRLPDDLAACEARLAARSPAPTQLDRDQLMYQAGWAACEASLAAVNPPPLKGGARGGIKRGTKRGTVAAWSFASAALAASLAIAVTLHVERSATSTSIAANSAEPQIASTKNDAIAKPGVPAARPTAGPAASQNNSAAVLAAIASFFSPPASQQRPNSALFAARAISLDGNSTDAPPFTLTPVNAASDAAASPPAKTAWQLLDEYLPSAKKPPRQPGVFWPWNSASLGETI
jgi:hypothetical protein